MKFKSLILVTSIGLALAACNEKASDEVAISTEIATGTEAATTENEALSSDVSKISYIFGSNVGNQFKQESIDLDAEAFTLGLKDVLAGNASQVGEEEGMAALQAFQEQKMAKQMEMQQVAGEANKLEGDTYRAENASKEGIVTLESGMQYKIVTAGSGKVPGAEETVEVHYRGTLLDGTEFDSSYKRGQPAQFGVHQVIAGWTEALQLMQEGAKWELIIPPELAYGPGGTGAIGPNATLLFEVELLKVLSE